MVLATTATAAVPLVTGCGGALQASSTAAGATGSVLITPPRDWTQTAELTGSDTVGSDFFGSSVSISGTTAIIGANGHLGGYGAGRAYVFTKTPTGWKQTAELKGSDTVNADWFGESVAISGTTAIVGAPDHAKFAGRAYVFTKTSKGWQQTAELGQSDALTGGQFGESVAISGRTVIVGVPDHTKFAGRAYLFTKTAAGWQQTAELKGSDSASHEFFGRSVAISGPSAIVGAEGQSNGAGQAYVFAKTTRGWNQTAEITGSDTIARDGFGWSVAISGTTAVVGANRHASSAGRAYVFTKSAAGWTQAAELEGSDTAGGQSSAGGIQRPFASAGDGFGGSVAISGGTVVVGAPGHANGAGRAYVFAKAASGWTQTAELQGSDTVALNFGNGFGASVSIAGTTAIVGAYLHAYSAGRAYVFEV